MKKFLGIMLMLCLLVVFPLATSSIPSVDAASKNTVILLQGTEQSDEEVKVDVEVKENTGILAMRLEIEFDKNVLELISVDGGTALSSLGVIWTGDLSLANSSGKLIIHGEGTGDPVNDYTTGKLMTLKFKVKKNVPDGNYSINLTYEKNKDIVYLSGKEFPTKNIVTNSVKVTLKESQIEKVETTEQEGEDKTAMWIAIGVSAAAVVGAGIGVGIVVAKKKGKWVKL